MRGRLTTTGLGARSRGWWATLPAFSSHTSSCGRLPTRRTRTTARPTSLLDLSRPTRATSTNRHWRTSTCESAPRQKSASQLFPDSRRPSPMPEPPPSLLFQVNLLLDTPARLDLQPPPSLHSQPSSTTSSPRPRATPTSTAPRLKAPSLREDLKVVPRTFTGEKLRLEKGS